MSLSVTQTAREDFKEARRKAIIGAFLDVFRRRSNDLLSLEDVRRRLNVRSQRYLGHQTVDLNTVIGSEGRYADFDRRFLPRNDAVRNRWSSVDEAILKDIQLPPVDLYKVGDIYFVRDGNHRVSVARQQGVGYIDAFVTELVVDVPLSPDTDVQDLMRKEEYSDFLNWTQLAELRPDQHIEFSELGGYLDLVRHINGHRYYHSLDEKRDVTRQEAVESWYDNVYMPIVRTIREQQVLDHFPGRTEADLYRWIMDHRWYTRERTGTDPGPESATHSYVEQFGRWRLDNVASKLRQSLERLKLPMSDQR